MTLLHLSLGVLVWSLYGYLGHRFWHTLMARGIHWRIYHKEELHHAHYDRPLLPDPRYASWPWEVWGMTLLLTVGYGWGLGLVSGLLFGLGAFGAMILDDQTHRAYHTGQLRWAWFARCHRAHHQTHACHYGFVTGALWDVLFRTTQRKVP